jgi:hypothetical protein
MLFALGIERLEAHVVGQQTPGKPPYRALRLPARFRHRVTCTQDAQVRRLRTILRTRLSLRFTPGRRRPHDRGAAEVTRPTRGPRLDN